jgi:hypothetical protein
MMMVTPRTLKSFGPFQDNLPGNPIQPTSNVAGVLDQSLLLDNKARAFGGTTQLAAASWEA